MVPGLAGSCLCLWYTRTPHLTRTYLWPRKAQAKVQARAKPASESPPTPGVTPTSTHKPTTAHTRCTPVPKAPTTHRAPHPERPSTNTTKRGRTRHTPRAPDAPTLQERLRPTDPQNPQKAGKKQAPAPVHPYANSQKPRKKEAPPQETKPHACASGERTTPTPREVYSCTPTRRRKLWLRLEPTQPMRPLVLGLGLRTHSLHARPCSSTHTDKPKYKHKPTQNARTRPGSSKGALPQKDKATPSSEYTPHDTDPTLPPMTRAWARAQATHYEESRARVVVLLSLARDSAYVPASLTTHLRTPLCTHTPPHLRTPAHLSARRKRE
ncbi:hypothetical protein B0H13DRAFT_2429555 [Mycena leptocephala]|nr:hypothetical protein B0H13DRAFT_2429555 [Mycena leptocephala]